MQPKQGKDWRHASCFKGKQMAQREIPIISFVAAKSGTGKTTLLEQIIFLLKQQGYRLGVLKHDAHRFEIDREGKDSWRFSKAGADQVMISSQQKLGFIEQLREEKSLEELLDYYHDVDLILIEGYKQNGYPKIEVSRKELNQALLYDDPAFATANFLAVASNDRQLTLPIPVLDINRPEEIVAFLVRRFLTEGSV